MASADHLDSYLATHCAAQSYSELCWSFLCTVSGLGLLCFNCTFVIVRLSLSIAIIGKIEDDVIAWQVKWPLPINK